MTDKIKFERRTTNLTGRLKAAKRAAIRGGDVQITRKQGQELLDRQARQYFGMNAKQFRDLYTHGVLNAQNYRVRQVSRLLPYMDDDK